LQWGALYLSFEYDSFFKSIKKASIFNKNYNDKNEQHFHILKVLFLCGFLRDCILTRGLTESVLFAPKPRAEGSSPSAPAKTKRHLRVSFYFVVKAEGLEPRNSKVLALLTVNSPVDCLRIELIIKPLPKKAPIFRCFFLYLRCFTAILLAFPI
jgi:hypothetical protein